MKVAKYEKHEIAAGEVSRHENSINMPVGVIRIRNGSWGAAFALHREVYLP